MKPVLFKAKRKDNGQLVIGYHVVVEPIDMPERYRKPKHVIFPIKSKSDLTTKCNWFDKYFYNAIEVKPDTVEVFNGNNKLPIYHLTGK